MQGQQQSSLDQRFEQHIKDFRSSSNYNRDQYLKITDLIMASFTSNDPELRTKATKQLEDIQMENLATHMINVLKIAYLHLCTVKSQGGGSIFAQKDQGMSQELTQDSMSNSQNPQATLSQIKYMLIYVKSALDKSFQFQTLEVQERLQLYASFMSCLQAGFSMEHKEYLRKGLQTAQQISHLDQHEESFQLMLQQYLLKNLTNQDVDFVNGILLALNSFIHAKLKGQNLDLVGYLKIMSGQLKSITQKMINAIQHQNFMGELKTAQQVSLLIEIYHKVVTGLFVENQNKGIVDLMEYCEAPSLFMLLMRLQFPQQKEFRLTTFVIINKLQNCFNQLKRLVLRTTYEVVKSFRLLIAEEGQKPAQHKIMRQFVGDTLNFAIKELYAMLNFNQTISLRMLSYDSQNLIPQQSCEEILKILTEMLMFDQITYSTFHENHKRIIVEILLLLMRDSKETLMNFENEFIDFVSQDQDLVTMQASDTVQCQAALLLKRLCIRIDGCMTWLFSFLIELFSLGMCQDRGQQVELAGSFPRLYEHQQSMIVSNKEIQAQGRINVALLTLGVISKVLITGDRDDLFEQFEYFMLQNFQGFQKLPQMPQSRLCLVLQQTLHRLYIDPQNQECFKAYIRYIFSCLEEGSGALSMQALKVIQNLMLDQSMLPRINPLMQDLISKFISLLNRPFQSTDFIDFFYTVIEEYGTRIKPFLPQIINILVQKCAKSIQTLYKHRDMDNDHQMIFRYLQTVKLILQIDCVIGPQYWPKIEDAMCQTIMFLERIDVFDYEDDIVMILNDILPRVGYSVIYFRYCSFIDALMKKSKNKIKPFYETFYKLCKYTNKLLKDQLQLPQNVAHTHKGSMILQKILETTLKLFFEFNQYNFSYILEEYFEFSLRLQMIQTFVQFFCTGEIFYQKYLSNTVRRMIDLMKKAQECQNEQSSYPVMIKITETILITIHYYPEETLTLLGQYKFTQTFISLIVETYSLYMRSIKSSKKILTIAMISILMHPQQAQLNESAVLKINQFLINLMTKNEWALGYVEDMSVQAQPETSKEVELDMLAQKTYEEERSQYLNHPQQKMMQMDKKTPQQAHRLHQYNISYYTTVEGDVQNFVQDFKMNINNIDEFRYFQDYFNDQRKQTQDKFLQELLKFISEDEIQRLQKIMSAFIAVEDQNGQIMSNGGSHSKQRIRRTVRVQKSGGKPVRRQKMKYGLKSQERSIRKR